MLIDESIDLTLSAATIMVCGGNNNPSNGIDNKIKTREISLTLKLDLQS